MNLHNAFFYNLYPGYTIGGPKFRSRFNNDDPVWYFRGSLLTKKRPWFSPLKGGCYKQKSRLIPPGAVRQKVCPDMDNANRYTAELFMWLKLYAYKKESDLDEA